MMEQNNADKLSLSATTDLSKQIYDDEKNLSFEEILESVRSEIPDIEDPTEESTELSDIFSALGKEHSFEKELKKKLAMVARAKEKAERTRAKRKKTKKHAKKNKRRK